jgi:polyhydroxybutyrate depolymerase
MKNSLQNLVLLILLLVFNVTSKMTFPQVQTGSFVFEGVLRDYLVFLPQKYNGVDKLPLVFNLHGATLNAQQQLDYSKMNEVADTAGFIIVYPNAVNTAWNSGTYTVDPYTNANDVAFIDVLIDTLAAHYSIDEERIYSCGFSMGGFMSYRLACQLSNRITAIADVAETMPKSLTSSYTTLHPMPVLKIHGSIDWVCYYNGRYDWSPVQATLDYWINFNHCNLPDTTLLPNIDTLDGCTVQKIKYTFSQDNGELVFYKVLNGGHTWPGGDKAYFTYISAGPIGNINMDINTSELIWNFFKNYKLSKQTSIKGDLQNPSTFALFQNYPNPFNPITKISWQSPVSSRQVLRVFDVLGNEVATLVDEYKPVGSYEIEFNASGLPSGIYFYRLQAGNFVSTKKMVLLK